MRENTDYSLTKGMLLKRGMGNGEWGMGNGELKMGNEKLKMGNLNFLHQLFIMWHKFFQQLLSISTFDMQRSAPE